MRMVTKWVKENVWYFRMLSTFFFNTYMVKNISFYIFCLNSIQYDTQTEKITLSRVYLKLSLGVIGINYSSR